MKKQRFNKQEAEAKIDRRVRILSPFLTLPPGTTGSVVEIVEVELGGWDIVVEWDARRNGRLHRDWVSKEQFDSYLHED